MIGIALTRGGNCLSKEYIDAKTKLEWQCKAGHSWFATPNHIKNGTWCPTCSQKNVSDSQRLNIKVAQNLATKNSGKCLSNEYKNARTKLLWECDKGHQWTAVYDSVRKGTWCPSCNGNLKKELKDCQNYALKFNGICLSKEYVNEHTNLIWKCDKGHTWSASPNNVKRGQWCPKCGNASVSQKLKM
jgi:Zn finger protein HypA/HybF involved in hydrogenase expression